MMLAHCGVPSPSASSWLAHLEPYISVSERVGRGRENRKLDVMWVQYLMLRLARDVWDRDAQRVDKFMIAFVQAERKAGKKFAVDGTFGDRTDEMIKAYQQLSINLPLEGSRGDTRMETSKDGVVHPAPNGGKTTPITSSGQLYTIAHMNERFRVVHRSYQNFIASDPEAPEALRRRVQDILPCTTDGTLPPASNTSSLHVSRGRYSKGQR